MRTYTFSALQEGYSRSASCSQMLAGFVTVTGWLYRHESEEAAGPCHQLPGSQCHLLGASVSPQPGQLWPLRCEQLLSGALEVVACFSF